MFIHCPNCEKYHELDGDDLPDHACDTEEYTCDHCDHEFDIGWFATAEVR